MSRMYRRDFLKLLFAVLFVPGFALGEAAKQRRLFTEEDEETIKALLDMIWPGSLEFNAPEVVSGWLGRREHKRALGYFRGQLGSFSAGCRKRHGNDFPGLNGGQKAAVMERLRLDHEPLYALLRLGALIAVFGDPIYGGNPDRKGWKMIGFDPGSQLPFAHLEY